MDTKTVAGLLQRLPVSTLPGPVTSTIWTVFVFVFWLFLGMKIKSRKNKLQDFGGIRKASLIIFVYYFAYTIDRWLHYGEVKVSYGYIIFEVIIRFILVGSIIATLWRTYELIWSELEGRFNPPEVRWRWFLGSKIMFFFVIFISLYFLVLFLALAIVWLQFLSLNIIGDIASRRNQFELAMNIIFAAFGLLTVIAALATVRMSQTIEGVAVMENKPQVSLLFASVFLWIRSMIGFIQTSLVFRAVKTKDSMRFSHDVLFGVFTTLFLISMYCSAYFYGKEDNMAGRQYSRVRANVRQEILDRLAQTTKNGVDQAPELTVVLRGVLDNLDSLLNDHALLRGSNKPVEEDRRTAQHYLQSLIRGAPSWRQLPGASQAQNGRNPRAVSAPAALGPRPPGDLFPGGGNGRRVSPKLSLSNMIRKITSRERLVPSPGPGGPQQQQYNFPPIPEHNMTGGQNQGWNAPRGTNPGAEQLRQANPAPRAAPPSQRAPTIASAQPTMWGSSRTPQPFHSAGSGGGGPSTGFMSPPRAMSPQPAAAFELQPLRPGESSQTLPRTRARHGNFPAIIPEEVRPYGPPPPSGAGGGQPSFGQEPYGGYQAQPPARGYAPAGPSDDDAAQAARLVAHGAFDTGQPSTSYSPPAPSSQSVPRRPVQGRSRYASN